MPKGLLARRCAGSGAKTEVPIDGIGHQCPACGMLTIPFENGKVRPHSALEGRANPPPCSRCGGPHPFDTSVPSVVWNETIRARGIPEYLCLTCIIEVFCCFGQSFTAELNGGPFQGGCQIEVRIRNEVAMDAIKIQDENNRLRVRIQEFAAGDADRAALPPQQDRIVQNWFTRLPMTKSGTKKAINWDDCEDLLRKLTQAEAEGTET